jgi:hypothetical protein
MPADEGTFPVNENSSKATRRRVMIPSSSPAPRHAETILVVEDEVLVRLELSAEKSTPLAQTQSRRILGVVPSRL